MLNLLTFMEYASYNFFLPEEKGIPVTVLRGLASRCGYNVETKKKNGQILYKFKKDKIPCDFLYSSQTKNALNYIDMADLHIGHPDCEIDRIKETLKYAVANNVDYVFIAGDIFDGVGEVEERRAKQIFESQLDIACSIFRKFPLDFRVIPGNHEFTFDINKIWNPLRILEEQLRGEQCQFHVYDSYIQDFEMAGIVKRMMHLESYHHIDNEFSVVHRLHEFSDNGGLYVKGFDGKRKPIRFLHCGHIHKKLEVYDSDLNVFITQPGAYITEQNYRMPFIHVKGDVLPDTRIVRG